MQHIYIFYIIISLSIGMVSLITTIVVSSITKDGLFIKYLFFYITFTFLIAIKLIHEYINFNIQTINPDFILLLGYFKLISKFLLLLTIPYFTNRLVEIQISKKIKIIFTVIVIATFTLSNISRYLINNAEFEKIIDFLFDISLIATYLYAFISGIYKYKFIKRKLSKRIVKSLIIFLGICLPFLAIEFTILKRLFSIPLYPVCYFGLSLIMTINILSYYVNISQMNVNPSLFDEISAENNISEREKEIILLIVKGYSNDKIGNTLFISTNTVKTHLRNIYYKFGINSRLELISLISTNPKG